MNKEPRYIEVVVDFVDRVHGTGFPEIKPWRPRFAIPVEFVDVVTGTDSCPSTMISTVFDFLSPLVLMGISIAETRV